MVQIGRLVDAITDSDEPVGLLADALKSKEAERVALEERIRMLGANNVVELHPKALAVYQQNIERLHQRLLDGHGDVETRMAFRNVIDTIVVHSTGYRQPYEITPYAKFAAIGGVYLFPPQRSQEKNPFI
ncbi:hypothetical protein [Bradyrhizobium sp. CCGE-LA001]|uniref:hypothetical protein n=1 Tax=Bradyrhizobium sp. CCGE-LA001 TaxID=1223566 RepID=UPI0002AAE156|nr:hypothetical protein [Bradyrhizobium sp. CCGE-LA001]AMA55960.1 hypothetical protein BCCGELA001_06570 [Bradyrhizobium sp. CCGE-LA001]